MILKEAIKSGCKFKNMHWINISGWFFLKDNQIRATFNHNYSVSIDEFIAWHSDENNWSLHPEDEAALKFNKKIEKLIE